MANAVVDFFSNAIRSIGRLFGAGGQTFYAYVDQKGWDRGDDPVALVVSSPTSAGFPSPLCYPPQPGNCPRKPITILNQAPVAIPPCGSPRGPATWAYQAKVS